MTVATRSVAASYPAAKAAVNQREAELLPDLELMLGRVFAGLAGDAAAALRSLAAAADWHRPDGDEVYDSATLEKEVNRLLGEAKTELDASLQLKLATQAPAGDYDVAGIAKLVAGRHRQEVQQLLHDGWQEGISVDQMAARLEGVGQSSANLVARTSMNGMNNSTSLAGAQFAGIKVKQWLATEDDRTRDSHVELDGQAAAIDGVFENGCRFPGDPNGAPEEVINCRCTLVYQMTMEGGAPDTEEQLNALLDVLAKEGELSAAQEKQYDELVAKLEAEDAPLEAEAEAVVPLGHDQYGRFDPVPVISLLEDQADVAKIFHPGGSALGGGGFVEEFGAAARLKASSQERLLGHLVTKEKDRWTSFQTPYLRYDSRYLKQLSTPDVWGVGNPNIRGVDQMNEMIGSWAGGSTDNLMSLRLQQAAAEEFGLPVTQSFAKTVEKFNHGQPIWEGVPAEVQTALRAFVRAQYDLTQQAFKEAGITHVTVSRGLGLPIEYDAMGLKVQQFDNFGRPLIPFEEVVDTTDGLIESNPLSSWTINPPVATTFSVGETLLGVEGRKYAYVMTAQVPVTRILSSPAYGFGCLNEYEFVVLGGKDTVHFWTRPAWTTELQALEGQAANTFDESDLYAIDEEGNLLDPAPIFGNDAAAVVNDFSPDVAFPELPPPAELINVADELLGKAATSDEIDKALSAIETSIDNILATAEAEDRGVTSAEQGLIDELSVKYQELEHHYPE